mmetsp:Transcript_74027/g.205128  ORF Transcript_74027/g.205128 Transcript_74027/m.205128 type:complete len:90 (-) Transcript_74027:35-304(-)
MLNAGSFPSIKVESKHRGRGHVDSGADDSTDADAAEVQRQLRIARLHIRMQDGDGGGKAGGAAPPRRDFGHYGRRITVHRPARSFSGLI